MSKLLFNLRHVPADEADEVRALLDENGIEFYETFAGNWGISLPALWLRDEAQFASARQLLDDYQTQRRNNIQEEYESIKQRGEVKTTWDSFVENPFRFVAYIGLMILVLTLSLQIFIAL